MNYGARVRTRKFQLFLKPIRGQDSILEAVHTTGDETQSTWTVSDFDILQSAYVMQVHAVTV